MLAKRIKTIPLVLASIVLLISGLFAYICWPLDTYPRLYKSAKSPDGSWTVDLYWKKRSLDVIAPVDISVKINDRDGNIVYDENVYIVDSYRQAQDYCSEIEFAGDEIRSGPGRMYEDGPGVRVIKTTTLKPK